MAVPHGQNKILERFSTILRVEQFCTVFAAARAFNGGEDLFSRHRGNGRGARPLPIARFVRSGGEFRETGGSSWRPLVKGNASVAFGESRHGNVELSRALPAGRRVGFAQ